MGTTRRILARIKDKICCKKAAHEPEEFSVPLVKPKKPITEIEEKASPSSPSQLNSQSPGDPDIIPFDELTFERAVNRGTYGIVYKGYWQGKEVAIKVLYNFEPLSKKLFFEENKILKHLKGLALSGVVEYYGSSFLGPLDDAPFIGPRCYLFVMQFVPGPSICTWIKTNLDKKLDLSWGKRYRLAEKMAAIIEEIAPHRVIHDDIKPEHFKFVVKTGDDKEDSPLVLIDWGFALKLSASEVFRDVGDERGTPGYKAPEVYKSKLSPRSEVSLESDVYALGISALTIIQMDSIYPDEWDESRIKEATLKNERPPLKISRPELAEFEEAVCKYDPRKRPSASVVREKLKRLAQEASALEADRAFCLSPTFHPRSPSQGDALSQPELPSQGVRLKIN